MSTDIETVIETPTVAHLALTGGIKPGATVRETRMIEIDARGIRVLGKLSKERFREVLLFWKFSRQMWDLGMANLVSYGIKEYGKEYMDDLVSQMEFDLADYNRALAIGQIPLDLWSDGLTSEHLYVLGSIKDEAERNKWRLLCEKHGMDAFTLKKSIEAGRVLTVKEIEAMRGSGTGFVSIHGIRHEFDVWQRKVGGEQAIAAFSMEEKKALLRELEAPGEMYLRLKSEVGS